MAGGARPASGSTGALGSMGLSGKTLSIVEEMVAAPGPSARAAAGGIPEGSARCAVGCSPELLEQPSSPDSVTTPISPTMMKNWLFRFKNRTNRGIDIMAMLEPKN